MARCDIDAAARVGAEVDPVADEPGDPFHAAVGFFETVAELFRQAQGAEPEFFVTFPVRIEDLAKLPE